MWEKFLGPQSPFGLPNLRAVRSDPVIWKKTDALNMHCYVGSWKDVHVQSCSYATRVGQQPGMFSLLINIHGAGEPSMCISCCLCAGVVKYRASLYKKIFFFFFGKCNFCESSMRFYRGNSTCLSPSCLKLPEATFIMWASDIGLSGLFLHQSVSTTVAHSCAMFFLITWRV